VARAHGCIADVAGFELVNDSISLRKKYAHLRRTADLVLPLIGIWVPVELAQSSGL
jgi:hypothetical protein